MHQLLQLTNTSNLLIWQYVIEERYRKLGIHVESIIEIKLNLKIQDSRGESTLRHYISKHKPCTLHDDQQCLHLEFRTAET